MLIDIIVVVIAAIVAMIAATVAITAAVVDVVAAAIAVTAVIVIWALCRRTQSWAVVTIAVVTFGAPHVGEGSWSTVHIVWSGNCKNQGLFHYQPKSNYNHTYICYNLKQQKVKSHNNKEYKKRL